MSLDLADTKITKNMCRGIRNNTEEVFVETFNGFNSHKGVFYQKMKAETIFGPRQASYT